MAEYELVARPPSAEAFAIFEHESLDDLEEALSDLFAEKSDGEFSFHPPRRPAFTVMDGFAMLVKLAEDLLPPEARVVASFGTERAAENAVRMLPAKDRPKRGAQMGGIAVEAVVGDLTKLRVEAIVNASNERLVLGGGVSDAIRRAVQDSAGLAGAMAALAPIASGDVVETESFGLPGVRLIFHAATASGDPADVRRALEKIFADCVPLAVQTIAIPALGCGTGQLAVARFAAIAREVLDAHAATGARAPRRVSFVFYDARAYREFEKAFGPIAERPPP